MSDNIAILEGFTRRVTAENSSCIRYLLCKPGTDFNSWFKAWDTDEQEFIFVKGWLCICTAEEEA